MSYNMLFSPMKIGNVEIKNRICMAPMLMGFGQFDGKATEQMMNYYEERAKGGAGLIFTEITRVNDLTGASSFGQLSVSKDENIKSLSEMAGRIHKHGAKLFVEVHHPGRQNVNLMINTVPVSVLCDRMMPKNSYAKLLYGSIVPFGKKMVEKDLFFRTAAPSKCEKSKFADSANRALTHKEIKTLIRQFVEGAYRVKQAGCDGVELHAAHGYLIQQFLSPATNRRSDEYGGSLENRMRFLTEMIQGIREKCGRDFPIVVRLSVDEMYAKVGQPDKGYSLQEGLRIAKRLSDLGIDAIDVSSAGYDTFNYWLEPASFECGWRKYLAHEVKKVVDIPVIAANLIRSPEQAERQLEEEIQDFVSLGRPMIADPHWANKAKEGRDNLIKRCICCLYCFESMMNGAYVGSHGHCSVNPFVGSETKCLPENGNGKKVLIIGAGPAGLTAAELLAKRKFEVTVLEKKGEIGGQIQLANKPPHKEKLTWSVTDLRENAVEAGAKIKLGVTADKKMIDSMNPDIVINATGGNAVQPKAFCGDNICTVTEILDGSVKLSGKSIAVIGSGMTGLETSELLIEQGNRVTIVEMADRIAPGAWFQHVDDAMPVLEKGGTVFMPGCKLLSVNEQGIEVENTRSGKRQSVSCDFVVLSMGVRPDTGLYDAIKDSNRYQVFNIGDSDKTGRIANATAAAWQLAMRL